MFERLAQPVVDGSLEGVNGTIFAYGQTGSGKTFTITGGPEKYAGARFAALHPEHPAKARRLPQTPSSHAP